MADISTSLFQPLDTGTPPAFDWLLDAPSLANDDSLETAIIISLFTDRRANNDDIIPDGSNNRRGWWADTYAEIEGDNTGSRLWLLHREKDMQIIVNRAHDYVVEALQWLIDDGVANHIDVITGWVDKVSGNITETKTRQSMPGVLGIAIVVYRPDNTVHQFQHVWQQNRQQDEGIYQGIQLPTPVLELPLVSDLSLKHGTGQVNFTRASTATYINHNGELLIANINEPRIQDGKILLEGETSNELLHSENLADAVYVKARTTISSNAAIAPDGTLTADKIVEDTSTEVNHHLKQKNIPIITGSINTYACFVKKAERDTLRFRASAATTADSIYINIDLTNGLITNQNSTGSGVLVATSIRAMVDDWYLVSITGKVNDTDTTAELRLFVSDEGDLTYDGDGNSGLYSWGWQLKTEDFLSSYIKTDAVAVVRNADQLTIINPSMPGPESSVTVICDVAAHAETLSQFLFAIGGETHRDLALNNDLIQSRHGTTIAQTQAIDLSQQVRIVYINDGNKLRVYVDGIEQSTIDEEAVIGDMAVLHIGHKDQQNHFNGHITKLRIFNRAFTPEEVTLL